MFMRIPRFRNDFSHNSSPKGVCSAIEEFRSTLRRERARADRGGSKFSVVIFDLTNEDKRAVSSIDLPALFAKRLRSTDVVGWFDKYCIGVYLFNTSTWGAWKFADDISRNIFSVFTSLVCRVYTYPHNQDSLNNGPGSGGSCDSKTEEYLFGSDDPVNSTKLACSDQPPQECAVTDPDLRKLDSSLELESLLACRVPPWKRICDILGALLGIVLASPLFLFLFVLIKSVSRGPVLFRQERIGYLRRPFMFWKIRTMKVHADCARHKSHVHDLINNEKPMNKLDDDPQIIPLGRLLRKSCIDELPQLINVLRGEMSLVGPRPCLPYEFQEYQFWHRKRFDILPGMTGLWQVNGKNKTTFTEMIRLDIAYEQQMSLWLDLRIIIKTMPAIIKQLLEDTIIREQYRNERCH